MSPQISLWPKITPKLPLIAPLCHGLAARRRAVKVFGRVEEGRGLEKVKVCDIMGAKVLVQIAKQNKAFSCSLRSTNKHQTDLCWSFWLQRSTSFISFHFGLFVYTQEAKIQTKYKAD